MKKLPLGTKVICTRDMDMPYTPPIHVSKGEIGTIVHVGPDASVGWYTVEFSDRKSFMAPIAPAPMSALEVITLTGGV